MKRYDFGPIEPADYEKADGKFVLHADRTASHYLQFDAFTEMCSRYFGCRDDEQIMRAWIFYFSATADPAPITEEEKKLFANYKIETVYATS